MVMPGKTETHGVTPTRRAVALLAIAAWPFFVIAASYFRGVGLALAASVGVIIYFFATRTLLADRPWFRQVVWSFLIFVWFAWCFASLMDFPRWYAQSRYPHGASQEQETGADSTNVVRP